MRDEPTLHWAHTRDGVRLALYNYRPPKLEPHRMPVFLCHGMGSNRADLDYPGLDQDLSLARYLHRHGHDVWVVELRGAGRSSRPGPLGLGYGWVLDDYIVHDIPAAVRRVLDLTARPAIHWVGHSMGGMLAYPFLAMSDPDICRSCVTVGAPSLARVSHWAFDAALKGVWALDYVPVLPNKWTARLFSPFVRYLRGSIERLLGTFIYNPENMTDETLRCLMQNAVENLSPALVKHLGEAYKTKHHRSYYRTFSIRDNLRRIETPVLIVAGSLDEMTPADDLKYVYEHVSSNDKEFVIVGKQSGATAEYGHVDLILGKNAPRDVFPMIQAWIARHEKAEQAGKAEEDDEVAAARRKKIA